MFLFIYASHVSIAHKLSPSLHGFCKRSQFQIEKPQLRSHFWCWNKPWVTVKYDRYSEFFIIFVFYFWFSEGYLKWVVGVNCFRIILEKQIKLSFKPLNNYVKQQSYCREVRAPKKIIPAQNRWQNFNNMHDGIIVGFFFGL